jgi:hypothetical protein
MGLVFPVVNDGDGAAIHVGGLMGERGMWGTGAFPATKRATHRLFSSLALTRID